MKSFFQRFHDSQPATSKSSRTKDAAYKQRISSSKPEKQHPRPSNGAEHPTEHHTTHAASSRPSNDSTADSHGHVATDYSTRCSTFPGSSTNRHLLPNPPRSRTYPLGSPANEQRVFPQTGTNRPPTGRNEPPGPSSHDGHDAFRVKSERPGQPHPSSPLPPTQQQHQVWLPEIQVEPKEKRSQRDRRPINEDESTALRPQQEPNPADSEHGGTHRHYGNERGTEANYPRRSDQKEKEPNSKEHHRDRASGVMKESPRWEQHLKDAHQLRERENRKKERLKLRREREDAEDKEKARAKEKLEQDRMRIKQGTSEKGEAKEKTRGDEWDRGEDDRMFRGERHQRRELQKEKEARERQIQLEQKDLDERRDRERVAKDERDRERRAKDEREQERRDRKVRERQVERERLAAREQTEKFEHERQERQRQKERDQQEKRIREQVELENRESEFLQRDRIAQKQVQLRKDQDIQQRELKPKEIDMLRADRERQERRKKDRQLWEQYREREREERERRWRGDQVRQVPEPDLSETGIDKVSIRSKKRLKEGVSDSEREQWHIHTSDRLALRASTQVDNPTETEDGRSAPNANSPRRLDCVDEPSEPQPLSKSTLRGEDYTLKKLQSQSRPPERNLSVPETSPVATLPKQAIQPPASSNIPSYNPSGFLISHNDIPPIERSGATAPIKSSPHPISYSVVRVPGPESSKQIPEVVAPQVVRRRTASSAQDQSATQPSRSAPSTQAQVPYPGPIPSRPTPFTSVALEGAPQDIKILPSETLVTQTGTLSVPQGSPSSFQETGSAGRGVIVAPPVTTPAATHLNAHGNQESPTQDHVIARSFQTVQLVPGVDHVAPVPPTPNQPSTASAGFLAVPSSHHAAKYSSMKDDIIPQNKEHPEYENPRQKDSVSQVTSHQPILPAPASKPAVAKRQSNSVPAQHEPPRDAATPGDNLRTTHMSRESPGAAHNKMQDETRLNNTFLQSLTVLPTDEFPLQVSTTLLEPQYLAEKLADQNSKRQRPIPEPVPPTVARYQESAHDKGHRTENHLTASAPDDSRGIGHSRHQRYASENDVNHRSGRPFKYPSEGLSTSHPQQIQEPKQRTNTSFVNPNNREDEKIAFRLPVDAQAIGTSSPDGKPQNLVSEPQFAIGPMLQDRQQQGYHVTISPSVPSAGFMTTAAVIGSAIARPGTAVPRSNVTQPSDDTLPHLRAVVPPISYSQSQSASRPPIDRPGTAIGIRQSVSTTSQSFPRGMQPATSKPGSNKAGSMPFPDKPVFSVRPVPTENISQEMPNEYTRSRTNSETVLVPNLSHLNETHNRLRADVPAQHIPYPAKEASSKTVSQTNITELSSKPTLSMMSPVAETIRPIGVLHPECTIQSYDDRPTTRSNTSGKVGGHGTTQQLSGLPQSYSEPAARQNDSGGQPVIHSTQPRQRKQSSPRLQSEGNLLKVPGQKGSSIEDQRLATYKTGQMHSTHRVEPTREDQSLLPIPGYLTETDISPLIQHPPAEDRGRSKYSADGYSPNALQRTSPMLGDSTSTLSHYPGMSKIEEGRLPRSQRNAIHVKDAKSAELPLPPRATDVPGQLYLHDARRNLASKLEQQQLDGSPNSASSNPLGNVEGDKRTRTRDEQSLRHVVGDSSPSISSKASQSPDSRTRDYVYVRTSPNTSQRNTSPRSRPVVVETQPQPGIQNWDEMPQHSTRTPALRPPLRERQDHIPEAEDKYSRTHNQTSTYATNNTGIRSSDTNQKIHTTSDRTPYHIQDPRAGKITSQRDGHRGETRDTPQPMATTHSRSQSDSQIALDNTISYSRRANNAPPHTILQKQPYLVPSSDHIRPSAPTVEPFLRPPDQSYSHSHQPDHLRVPREEAIVPQQTVQPPMIKSTPPRRDTIEPLPQEAHYQNVLSGPQPPTPQSYDIWLPPTSSREHRTSHRSTVTRASHKDSGRERERARRSTTTPRTHQSSASESHPLTMDPRLARAYHYIKTRKAQTMSLVSVEAQDGAASTVIGSPTASILSQIPINIPPEQDPILAAREWTEAGAIIPGQRIRKPGLVWADPEDPPLNYQQVHRPRSSLRRRTRSSGSRSREASDSDQPLPA